MSVSNEDANQALLGAQITCLDENEQLIDAMQLTIGQGHQVRSCVLHSGLTQSSYRNAMLQHTPC